MSSHSQTDHLNSPRRIYDQSQQLVWTWEQGEPFGNDVPNSNPSGAGAFDFPLRFPGQYFDRETNLAYNAMRDYDPSIGRYVQPDPLGVLTISELTGMTGLNHLYSYAQSDPLRFSDPEGLDPRIYRTWALALAAANAAKKAIEKIYDICKRIRCVIHNDPAHHYFG